VNPELGGMTLGWTALNTAQDELFAAIEGTAFHTRVIFDRMAEFGVPIRQVINGGGIPQKNEVLNRVYANVLNKPVLVPETEVTSLGSAIFAFLAAGTFKTIEEAQKQLCPKYRVVEPDAGSALVYDELYPAWRKVYFGFGQKTAQPISAGDVLPLVRRVAKEAHNKINAAAKIA
jgi:L-ribulokinase